MKLVTLVLTLMVMVLGASFAALNANPVTLNYYIGESTMPLSLLLVLTLGLGGILGIGASVAFVLKVQHENRCLKKQIKIGEKEIANLRTLPIQNGH